MYSAEIDINDDLKRYTVGDTLIGTARLTTPPNLPLANVQLSFNCIGEVKWNEYHGTPHYLNKGVCCDQLSYHEDVFPFSERDVTVVEDITSKRVSIPLKFIIPENKNLPSTMVSNYGFIKHFVCVAIKEQNSEQAKKFIKEVIVQSPIERKLMVTVGGTAEKRVLLHNGKVSMHATIDRKGFVPDDTITVHVAVNNQTNARVTPRLSLTQVQIFMCEDRHKTVETTLNENDIIGTEIEPQTEVEEVLTVAIPACAHECLTIKSSLITVKYFVRVTLVIPHSFDLQINLPVVITSEKVLHDLQLKRNQLKSLSEKSF